jgi:hypothetical protein
MIDEVFSDWNLLELRASDNRSGGETVELN